MTLCASTPRISRDTGLTIYLLDGKDVKAIRRDPSEIALILEQKAESLMAFKAGEATEEGGGWLWTVED